MDLGFNLDEVEGNGFGLSLSWEGFGVSRWIKEPGIRVGEGLF